MTIRTTLSATLAAAAVLAATLLAAAPVFAHARYKSSTPGTGEVLTASPSRVEITFTEQLQKVSGTYGIEVSRDRGALVATGPAVVDDTDRTKLSISLQAPLPPGRYVVNWKNVSDQDGDAATGAFSFYVSTQPNAVDLDNDRQLAQVGFEEVTATAAAAQGTATGATTPSGSTPATTAAATGSGSPAISAATPIPTSASTGGGGGTNTSLIIIIVAAVVGGAFVGFAGWQYAVRRRK